MIPTLETIIKASGIHPSRVFNVYLFGSRIYGNYNSSSDYDFIVVANNSVESTVRLEEDCLIFTFILLISLRLTWNGIV